jgi:hypothetical protein
LHTETPCTIKDKQFFAAATTITVGTGDNISFWESAWLQGGSPRDIAPTYTASTTTETIFTTAIFTDGS